MSTKRTLIAIALGLLLLFGVVAALTTWYTVDESEQAVVITFGKSGETITESGLHFKLPWPIQKVEVLSKETFSLEFGYKERSQGDIDVYPSETKMITGDEFFVLTDLVVQWKITDPKKYLFNSQEPKELLHSATSSAIRSIIGNSKIDAALTDGKSDIESRTRELLTSLMEKYDVGISVLGVKLQDVELPNEEVRAAFTAVTDAREMRNTKINQADKYKNQRLSEVEGEIAAIKSKAEGQRVARIEQAVGDVAVFNQLYNEYKGNQAITRERLVLETLEMVLPHAQIYIMNDNEGNTLKYLPIQQTTTAKPKEEGSGSQ
ncbi:FtsH protease activity modulator HflK [Metasolibacillus sp. FSL H7-0170]|uniref:FtsH protease activity modulator HflK n=1 Tax=Metasolibacillus TaxID=2703677 RepID=UPI0007948A8B|nr:FtsH protease activity modulator HflK [Metasolibacillus fluoroglycofenilyticus]KYG91535.1 HflK protein [[Bacillus] sp. KCTC 13219]